MPTTIINGVEYCVELDEDDGDNTNRPSPPSIEAEVASHCKQASISELNHPPLSV